MPTINIPSVKELIEEIAKLRDELSDCTRSHPHENMTVTCKLRTETARLGNALANAEARIKAAEEQEPIAWIDRYECVHFHKHPNLHLEPLYAKPTPPVDVQESASLIVKQMKRIAELEKLLLTQAASLMNLGAVPMENEQ